MKAAIFQMQGELLKALGELGQMSMNLQEAAEWVKDGGLAKVHRENALLELESVVTGAEQVTQHVRAISLKCEELIALGAGKGAK